MALFNGWTVVTMPSTPAPKSVEFTQQSIVGAALNPFTGQQQIHDWDAGYTELSVSMPPMAQVVAAPWVDFLTACKGQACVFQLPSVAVAGSGVTFASLVPASANVNGYWRMKSNSLKWSVNDGVVYGFSFEIREAI